MANDRLYIVCQCRELAMLYKYYPGSGYIGEAVAEFIDQHSLSCHNDLSPAMFSLVWENDAAALTHRKNTSCNWGQK